jgi:DNA-binding response OmpR family regulator
MTTATLGAKPKVLAVDDDPDLLHFLEIALGRAGYEVGLASDGDEALDYVEANNPDLVVLDLGLPRVNGFTVLEALDRRRREHTEPGPRVICLTGRSAADGKHKALELGVDEYVTKPFGIDQIVRVVRDVSRRDGEERKWRRRSALDGLSWT